jgi:hypothetical protein
MLPTIPKITWVILIGVLLIVGMTIFIATTGTPPPTANKNLNSTDQVAIPEMNDFYNISGFIQSTTGDQIKVSTNLRGKETLFTVIINDQTQILDDNVGEIKIPLLGEKATPRPTVTRNSLQVGKEVAAFSPALIGKSTTFTASVIEILPEQPK